MLAHPITTHIPTTTSPLSSEEDEASVVADIVGMPVESIWDFLEVSGFLYPEKRQLIDFDAAKSTIGKLTQCDSNVFKGLVVLRGSSIYAHISSVRIYDKVWMVQHLASRPYKKEKTSHALMLNLALLEYFERSSDVEWIQATYRHENKRVSRLYESLASQVTNPELSVTQFLTCMRISGTTLEVQTPRHLEVGRLTTSEVLGLNRGRERFNGLSEEYAKLGLERRQEFIGVFHAGRLVGYSVLEISSPGLNLSELTNAFRVSMLENDPKALSFLIRMSVDHYRHIGQRQVVALVEDQLVQSFKSLGFDAFKRYTFWTWHQSLCRQFHDYISRWQ
jgi:hypothetical protein